MKNSRKTAAAVTLLIIGEAAARIAMADTSADAAVSTDTAADAAANGPTEALQEVTVVAQKQNIGLQHAPVALTAITGDALKQAAIVSPMDLNGQVPGLVITSSEGYNRSVSIRSSGFNVPQDDSAKTSVA